MMRVELRCDVSETSLHLWQLSAFCWPLPVLAGRAVEQSIIDPLLSPAFVSSTTFSLTKPIF